MQGLTEDDSLHPKLFVQRSLSQLDKMCKNNSTHKFSRKFRRKVKIKKFPSFPFESIVNKLKGKAEVELILIMADLETLHSSEKVNSDAQFQFVVPAKLKDVSPVKIPPHLTVTKERMEKTVLAVKQELSGFCRIEDFHLRVLGEPLSDEAKLVKDHGVEVGMKIHVSPRLRGGAGNQMDVNNPNQQLIVLTGGELQTRSNNFVTEVKKISNWTPGNLMKNAQVNSGGCASGCLEWLQQKASPSLNQSLQWIEKGKREAVMLCKSSYNKLNQTHQKGSHQCAQAQAGIEAVWKASVDVFKRKTNEINSVKAEIDNLVEVLKKEAEIQQKKQQALFLMDNVNQEFGCAKQHLVGVTVHLTDPKSGRRHWFRVSKNKTWEAVSLNDMRDGRHKNWWDQKPTPNDPSQLTEEQLLNKMNSDVDV